MASRLPPGASTVPPASLRALLDAGSEALLVFDARAVLLWCNRAAIGLLGCTPGQTLAQLEAALGRDLVARARAAPDGEPLRDRLADGRAVSVAAQPLELAQWALRLRPADELERELQKLAEERELAQIEIGALMDAAGVGVATFEESRGWMRSAQGRREAAAAGGPGLQAISRDVVHPDSLPEYERLQQALKAGERVEVRYAVSHPDTGQRWLLTRVEPGRLQSGRRTTSVVTLDVTAQEQARRRNEQLLRENVDERHRARDALVSQADRTRAILDSVLVGIVTVGERGIAWMNRSARRMFGGELADFVGQPIAIVATPDPDHPLRRGHYLHELIEGQAEAFECRLKARDGREFWVVGNAVVTGHAAAERQVTFALLDIERRRQAEVSIAQARASLQHIIEAAPMAIVLLDATRLRVLQLNQMAATFAGCAIDEAVGRSPGELFEPSFGSRLVEDLRAALASPEVSRREYRLAAPSGTRVWDARIVPLAGAAGAAPEQLLFVANDVTEQRNADEARFEAAIAQRDMLVKEVHHRIKNNLQGVAGLMQQIAQRRPEVAPVITEAIGQVQAIAQVYGLQVGVAGPLRVRSVLEAITASVSRTLGRTIAVEVTGHSPQRWALPEAESIPIALTINELLANAIRHGGGGDVRCTLSCGEHQVNRSHDACAGL